MSNDPEQIRQDIERTQSNLSYDVNQLGETVRPGNVARRQAGKVGGAATSLRDRVMGTGSSMQSSASDAADRASEAQDRARSEVRGNPLAAGLVAFGVGAVLGSLLPASDREQQAAVAVKDRAAPVVDEVKEVAKETAEDLKPRAKEAVQATKEQAADSAQNVKQEGQQTAEDVKGRAQEARSNVQQSRD